MSVFKTFSALTLGLCLSACATLISSPTQELTVNTPGATEAQCTVDNSLRYPIRSGQTIKIMRSENPLIVDCYASGDRHRRMRVSADGNEWAMLNVTNGIIPGLTYDHFAKGLYKYPDVVTIDFTGVPAKGFDLPAYHNKDAPNPYDQGIENFGPSKSKLESDRYKAPVSVSKINNGGAGQIDPSLMAPVGVTLTPAPAGNVTNTAPALPSGSDAESLTRSANSDVFDK